MFSSVTLAAQTNFPARLEENVWRVGFLSHPALTESSGLTASKQYAGVFWSHSDDGEPFIFAVNRRGESIGAFEVYGANLIDWEGISADDFGNLYIADTGTNGMERTHSAIHRVEEPDPSDERSRVTVEQTWYVRFPGEREDVESLFILENHCYLITKFPRDGVVTMYRFLLGSSTEYVLEPVATIPMETEVSDAAISPDRQRLALVTDEGVIVYFINGDPATVSPEASADTEFENSQMEGITFVPDGLLVTSEEREVLLFDSEQLTGAPEITRPLSDQTAFVGSNVVFSVVATGVPDVTFTWLFNGSLLRGETNSTLVITNVTAADAGTYEVIVANANGTARSSAQLTVIERRFDVRITEVMSSETLGTFAKADWWELTSFDTNVVDLGGWRFNDSSGDLTDAFVIPNGVLIQPGESIIFVENLTPAEFRAWWGENNIPAETQIITYSGVQLSFAATGDTLRLWSSDTTDVNAVYQQVSFGAAAAGVSFGYDPYLELFGEPSQVGVHGAFLSADGLDVASPGRLRLPDLPPTGIDLRISEVMSNPAPGVIPKADWWELTSFHTNTVDLTGWRFNDSTGGTNDAFIIPTGVTIAPGESILFVENLTPAEFLAWWGETNISPGTQIIAYSGPELSFSSLGDSLRLWTTNTLEAFRQVSFGAAAPGISFGFNPVTGTFGEPSEPGVNGAFTSTTGDDVGSPGRIRTPPEDSIDVRITEVTSSEATTAVPTADWWELTSFDTQTVDLSGWLFNDGTGGLNDAFVIPNGISIAPGESIIFVEDLAPAEFLAWWGDQNVSPGTQIITYSGIELSFSSTGDSLRLWTNGTIDTNIVLTQVSFGAADLGVSFGYNPDAEIFGERSRVGVHGAFVAAAGPDVASPGRIRGEVTNVIDVRITEVMSSEAMGSASTADWWELTSFETSPIDLSGWRFNDSTGDANDAFVIPNGTTIQPGESIVFVEDLTPTEFRTWWGEANLSPALQIITYTGIELSFAATGDSLRLWTADTNSILTQVAFGAADVGVSFGYDPVSGSFGQKSISGVNGAFTAAIGPDVGSPGRIRNESGLQVQFTADAVQIQILEPGAALYEVEATDDIARGEWISTGDLLSSTNGAAILFQKPLEGPMRFYRVRKLN